jgi:hypothetical protein
VGRARRQAGGGTARGCCWRFGTSTPPATTRCSPTSPPPTHTRPDPAARARPAAPPRFPLPACNVSSFHPVHDPAPRSDAQLGAQELEQSARPRLVRRPHRPRGSIGAAGRADFVGAGGRRASASEAPARRPFARLCPGDGRHGEQYVRGRALLMDMERAPLGNNMPCTKPCATRGTGFSRRL